MILATNNKGKLKEIKEICTNSIYSQYYQKRKYEIIRFFLCIAVHHLGFLSFYLGVKLFLTVNSLLYLEA